MISSININNVSFRYDDDYVIKSINYSFYQNNIYGISGKNASGKTTLLKLISGLISPQIGKIEYINNKTLEKSKIKLQKQISFSAPYVNYVPELSADDNYKIISKLRGSNINTDKLNELLDLFFLKDFYKMQINQLSTGTVGKFKIIHNLLFESDIHIFDEPLENIDEVSKNSFIKYLSSQKSNKIIILSSSKYEEIEFCNFIITL